MAELSRSTGVPVPTIKFYLREGLLPPGMRTSPNQAQYTDEHARRLRLIRALVDVGGLPIATTRAVLGHLDETGGTINTLGKVQYSITRRQEREPEQDEAWLAATDQVEQLITRHGWSVRAKNPARADLAEVIATLRRLGQHDILDLLDGYAEAAHRLADVEVAALWRRTSMEDRAEGVVMLGVLADAILGALRRLAQEDVVNRSAADHGVVTGDGARPSSPGGTRGAPPEGV